LSPSTTRSSSHSRKWKPMVPRNPCLNFSAAWFRAGTASGVKLLLTHYSPGPDAGSDHRPSHVPALQHFLDLSHQLLEPGAEIFHQNPPAQAQRGTAAIERDHGGVVIQHQGNPDGADIAVPFPIGGAETVFFIFAISPLQPFLPLRPAFRIVLADQTVMSGAILFGETGQIGPAHRRPRHRHP